MGWFSELAMGGAVKAPGASSSRSASKAPGRLDSLDALRGLAIAMLLLINTTGIPGSLPYQLSHPEWHGFAFIDAFFPVFLFSMGASMEFSSKAGRFAMVLRRVVILFLLGMGLSSLRAGSFVVMPGILQKIAIAYLLAWAVMRLPRRLHLPIAGGILAVLWVAFMWVPAPGVVPGSWEPHVNFGAFIDRAIIGHPATEGVASAIPATVNVLGGAIVVRQVRRLDPRQGLVRICVWAAGAMALGLLLSAVIPINKRLWTASFTILTHGMACGYLALFWIVAEMRGWRAQVRPFVVLGRNPILIYVLFTAGHELVAPVRVPLMDTVAGEIGGMGASLTWSALMIALGWALAAWLDRRRTYFRI